MRYQDLEVYEKSYELFLKLHKASLLLPKHEMYELGSQVRRSADSVNSNIVEGYGRKAYRKDYIKFLTYSLASNDETINHLKKLKEIYPHLEILSELYQEYNILGKSLNNFLFHVINNYFPPPIK